MNSSAAKPLKGTTVVEMIAIRLVRQALKGNVQAIQEITDRTEGRVPQAQVEEPEDREIKVNIEYVGGTEAFESVRREFEEANGPICKTN